MDPLTALSVAGTVIQFVEFGCTILNGSRELYQSTTGALPANQEAELITRDLLAFIFKLQRPLFTQDVPMTPEQRVQYRDLQKICTGCETVARELLQLLEHLKIQGKSSAWSSIHWRTLHSAIKATLKRKDVEELEHRLSGFRKALEMHVLSDLRHVFLGDMEALLIDCVGRSMTNSITLQQSEHFRDLDKKTQNILLALLDTQDAFTKNLDEQTLAIAEMLNRTEVILTHQHDDTRALIVNVLREAGMLAESKGQYGTPGENEKASAICKEEEGLRLLVEDKILDSLYFKTVADRQEEVANAHRKTFAWIFHPESSSGQLQCNFTRWLEDGHGTYWINGKAGSGKSTLMRYISNSEETRKRLLSWSGSTPLIISSFYFWNSGSVEQRSQSGLFRSLLYDILRRHPELIPIVLPTVWARTYSQSIQPVRRQKATAPSLEQLMSGFKTLVRQTVMPFKLCLFIDGLDEYEGSSAHIADLFTDLVTSNNIKICLSSRPMVAFEYAFKNSPSIRLQDLTFEDIKSYVGDKLNDNARFQMLAFREGQKAHALIEELVNKADGVFLWVTLVVESILEGLGNQDEISDLQRRLWELPSDLEALFDDMLKRRIGDFYQKKAAMIFQIVRASRERNDQLEAFGNTPLPLTLLALSFAEDNNDNEQLISADSFFCPLDKIQISVRCNTMEDRLKTSCAGLLEVRGTINSDPGVSRIGLAKPDGKVQYLHRTVKDYLDQPDVRQTITAKTETLDFDPNALLLRSCVLQLKTSQVGTAVPIPDNLWCCMSLGLEYSRQAELYQNSSYISLLDQLDFLMNQLLEPRKSSYPGHWARFYLLGNERPLDWDDTTTALAVEYGLCSYLRYKFRQSSQNLCEKLGRPLLDYAVSPKPRKQRYGICPDAVSILLQYGADPNKKYFKTTPWENALAFAYSLQFRESWLGSNNQRKQPKRSEVMILLSLFKKFVDHGANPNGKCVVRSVDEDLDDYRSALFIVHDVFVRWYPEESEELASELRQRGASVEVIPDSRWYQTVTLSVWREVKFKFW